MLGSTNNHSSRILAKLEHEVVVCARIVLGKELSRSLLA